VSIAPPGAPHVPGSIPCPRCAATVGPDQEWCLACGAPARTRLVPTPNWRAPIAVLATVAVLAGIALALAFVSLTNDKEPAAPVNSQAPPPSATDGQPQSAAPTTALPTTTAAPTTGQSTGAGASGTESTDTASGIAGTAGRDTATGQSTGTATGQSTGTSTGQSTSTGTSTGQSTSTGSSTGATTTTGPG
jgi:hypothetical protein